MQPILEEDNPNMQNPDVQNVMNSLGIIGRSTDLIKAINAAIQVAPFDVSVLVTGENGVGKDSFYKILHNGSRRRHNKCIAVNCGGLPEGTIDSELFGHVKGAYTGSVGDRKGYFEEADGGTIFLDEVGDLPMSIQAKLLRVLEKGEILRMGSNEVRKVDVRVVAATNVDLQKAIREGKFREDLYYRLSTISIHVPSLRERQDDIYLLFRYFANETAKKYRMTQAVQLTPEARQMLQAYNWPGNVRQLLHLVEELSIIEMERLVTPEVLKHYLRDFVNPSVAPGGGGSTREDGFTPGEKAMLYQIISQMRQELNEVREHLGMSSTATHPAHKQLALPSTDKSTTIVNPDSFVDAVEAEEVDAAEERTSERGQGTTSNHNNRPLTMAEIEKQAIIDSLKRNNGNKRKVAEELQVSERTIHRKVEDYGLGKD